MNQPEAEGMLSGRRAIVVMGVSGSGKSTLAAMLARKLDVAMIEGDDLHPPANVAKMHAGRALDDDDRWPWLDAVGAALGRAAGDHGYAVASCSALKRSYRVRLEVAARQPIAFVLLDLDRAALLRRMNDRPGHFMPASLLDSQLQTLERPQPDEAAIILDGREPRERLCEHLLALLGTRNDGADTSPSAPAPAGCSVQDPTI